MFDIPGMFALVVLIVLKNWSDGEILRALRWGEHRNGRMLAQTLHRFGQTPTEYSPMRGAL